MVYLRATWCVFLFGVCLLRVILELLRGVEFRIAFLTFFCSLVSRHVTCLENYFKFKC